MGAGWDCLGLPETAGVAAGIPSAGQLVDDADDGVSMTYS